MNLLTLLQEETDMDLIQNFFGGILIEGIIDIFLYSLYTSSFSLLRLLGTVGYAGALCIIIFSICTVPIRIETKKEALLCGSTYMGGGTAYFLLRRFLF